MVYFHLRPSVSPPVCRHPGKLGYFFAGGFDRGLLLRPGAGDRPARQRGEDDRVYLTSSCFLRVFALWLESALWEGRAGVRKKWIGLVYSTTLLCWASKASDVDGYALHLPCL